MNKVVIIGNVNVDILASSYNKIINNDSNPGKVNIVSGGVAHNIACNLCNLNVSLEFVSAFSTDYFGQMLYKECASKLMRLENCQFFDNYPSSCFVAIMDDTKELHTGICDCEIMEHFDLVKIYPLLSKLDASDILLIDINLSKEKVFEIISHTKARIFCDPISAQKGLKIKDYLENFYMFKPNYLEAIQISGLNNPTDKELLDYYLSKGIKEIVVSKGSEGVIGADGTNYYHVESCSKKIVSTNGAGDSFTAGYIYATLRQIPFLGRLIIAEVCASITISSPNSISDIMDEETVKQIFDIVKHNIKVEEL